MGQELQLARLAFFSDGVFAIAITLLAVEIKFPEFQTGRLSEMDLVRALVDLIPKFIGFLVSFFLIGLYWTVHHRLFGYIIKYDHTLLWLNLFFLFSIAIMPFNTGFYTAYVSRGMLTPIIFYSGNIILLGLSNVLIWRYAGNLEHQLAPGLNRKAARYFSLNALIFPVMFTITAFVYLVAPKIAVFIPCTIFIIRKFILHPMKKKILLNQK